MRPSCHSVVAEEMKTNEKLRVQALVMEIQEKTMGFSHRGFRDTGEIMNDMWMTSEWQVGIWGNTPQAKVRELSKESHELQAQRIKSLWTSDVDIWGESQLHEDRLKNRKTDTRCRHGRNTQRKMCCRQNDGTADTRDFWELSWMTET